jgi:hypothetical protein
MKAAKYASDVTVCERYRRECRIINAATAS